MFVFYIQLQGWCLRKLPRCTGIMFTIAPLYLPGLPHTGIGFVHYTYYSSLLFAAITFGALGKIYSTCTPKGTAGVPRIFPSYVTKYLARGD